MLLILLKNDMSFYTLVLKFMVFKKKLNFNPINEYNFKFILIKQFVYCTHN